MNVTGDKYDGTWKRGKANGLGKKTYRNGATYEGEWKDDAFHGKGEEKWIDGSKYIGCY